MTAAAVKVIEGQRDFIRLLLERHGEIVVALEEGTVDQEAAHRYAEEMRPWLLGVKSIESNVNEMLETMRDVETLRRIL